MCFSFGNGRSREAFDSWSWLPTLLHHWVRSNCWFCIPYNRLENAAGRLYSAKYRVPSLLVVRSILSSLYFIDTAFKSDSASLNNVSTTFHRFIPESARWLLTKGRTQEAKDILQRASLENGVDMPREALDTLLSHNGDDSAPDYRKPSLFDLFRYPNLRRKSILLFFNWYYLISNVF